MTSTPTIEWWASLVTYCQFYVKIYSIKSQMKVCIKIIRDHLLYLDVTHFLCACLWPGIYGSGRLDTTVGCFWLCCIYSGTDSRAALTSVWRVWIYLKIHLVTAYKHQSEDRNHTHENTHYGNKIIHVTAEWKTEDYGIKYIHSNQMTTSHWLHILFQTC